MELEYNNLDDGWIRDFEKIDKLYKDFYKDDLYYINLRVVYVNRDNEIDKIKNEPFLLSKPNYVSREEIIGILKKNTNDCERRYTLLSMLTYNIGLEPDEIKQYIMDKNPANYLRVIKHIDAITLQKSITMFHDLNDLILIFYEKSNELVKKDPNNTTKKVFIRTLNGHKKTIKNRFKD
jgi:hypothetical protein